MLADAVYDACASVGESSHRNVLSLVLAESVISTTPKHLRRVWSTCDNGTQKCRTDKTGRRRLLRHVWRKCTETTQTAEGLTNPTVSNASELLCKTISVAPSLSLADNWEWFTSGADHQSPLHDLDLPGKKEYSRPGRCISFGQRMPRST